MSSAKLSMVDLMHYNRSLLFLAVALVTCWPVPSVRGTDRIYPDREVKSPNGRWMATAKSPDNDPANAPPSRRVAFQDDFVFELRDVQTKQLIWRVEQGKTGSPTKLFLDNQGRLVYWAEGEELFLIRRDGTRQRLLALRDALTPEEWDEFVSETTAGPMWSGMSRWYFANVDDRSLFVIRTWWGHRLGSDLEEQVLLAELDDQTTGQLDGLDRQWALERLQRAAEQAPEEKCGWDVRTAIHLAGVLGVDEAVEPLRQLEPRADWLASSISFDDSIPVLRDYRLRQAVHLSLRRLGETPAGYPPTVLWLRGHRPIPDVDQAWEPPRGMTRAEAAEGVRQGMEWHKVIYLIGAPASTDVRGEAPGEWGVEFDIDARTPDEEPFTLRVWFRNGQVHRLERITPPVWESGLQRDRELAI